MQRSNSYFGMKILIEQFKNRIEVEYKSSIKTAMHL